MRYHTLSGSMILALTMAIFPTATTAATPYAKILFPADGAKLDAMAQNRMDYEVSPGPNGDHIHLYVDSKEAAIVRKLSGSHPLESLTPGTHSLCIKVVNKAHVPIGVEHCIKVNVE
ncbi:MAG: hypothetical protein ABIG70_08365 [Pseudomonadota bacterium]